MKTRKSVLTMALAVAALCVTPALADSFSETTTTTTTVTTPIQRDNLRAAAGEDVFGANREFLGTIINVDVLRNLAELQLPAGVAISVAGEKLMNRGDHVIAPTLTRDDTMAMAREQDGTTVALDLGTIPSWDVD